VIRFQAAQAKEGEVAGIVERICEGGRRRRSWGGLALASGLRA